MRLLAHLGGVERAGGQCIGIGARDIAIGIQRAAIGGVTGGAFFDEFLVVLADIAIDGVAAAHARVGQCMQRGVRSETMVQLRGEQRIAIAGEIGRGVHRAAVGAIQAGLGAIVGVARIRQQAIADQAAAPVQQRQAPIGLLALLADLAEHGSQTAFGGIAPAVLVETGDRDKAMPAVLTGETVTGVQSLARTAADAQLALHSRW